MLRKWPSAIRCSKHVCVNICVYHESWPWHNVLHDFLRWVWTLYIVVHWFYSQKKRFCCKNKFGKFWIFLQKKRKKMQKNEKDKMKQKMDTFSIVWKKKKYDTFLRKIKNPPSKCWIMNSKYKRPLFRNHGSQWHRTMAAVKAMASESCFYGASVCLDFTNHFYTQRRKKIWLNWTKMHKQCLVSIQFFNGWHWVGIWLAFACLSETLNVIMSATNSNQCHIKIKTYTKYNREAEWFTRFAHKTDFLKTATRAIKRKKKKQQQTHEIINKWKPKHYSPFRGMFITLYHSLCCQKQHLWWG